MNGVGAHARCLVLAKLNMSQEGPTRQGSTKPASETNRNDKSSDHSAEVGVAHRDCCTTVLLYYSRTYGHPAILPTFACRCACSQELVVATAVPEATCIFVYTDISIRVLLDIKHEALRREIALRSIRDRSTQVWSR